jgi:hypothetical protein
MTQQNNINTSAQIGTGSFEENQPTTEIQISGEGSDMGNKQSWKGRAKRKTISQNLHLSLIKAVENKGEPERKRAYWKAYHCQSKLISHDGRLYGKYCKTRSCPICCSIRKARLISQYYPVLKTWEDPFFVTLTVKAVKAGSLPLWMFGFKKAFRQILGKLKKQHQRGGGLKVMGIKSLECNFNPAKRTYNPHYHLIVPNEAVADALIYEWQKKWTTKYTYHKAQHKRRVWNMERDLIETIKYGSKVFTEPDVKNKGKYPPKVYAAALDNILQAMKPYRLFERFGFNLPKEARRSKAQSIPKIQAGEWEFDLSKHDWINKETGERLTGYVPLPQVLWILSQNVDTTLD